MGGALFAPTIFRQLSDVPQTYASQARKRLRVNTGESALEFYSGPALYAEDYCAFDGVTDDTANLNSLFSSLTASGGYRRIVCPYGKTALISGEVAIAKNDVVVDDLNLKLKNSATGITRMLYITGTNIILNRPDIDGNSPNNTTLNVAGIQAEANKFYLNDGNIRNLTLYGVLVNGGTTGLSYFRIVNSRISDIGNRGISIIHAKDGLISGNTIVSTGSHALDIQRGSIPGTYNCERLRITENYATRAVPPVVLSPSLGAENGGLLALDLGAKYITVDGNILWDNRTGGDDGIILGQDGTNDPTDVIITNNIVGYAGNFGIDATTRSVVDGNYVYKAGAYGIVAVIDVGGSLTDAIISNNLIIDPMNDGNVGYSGGIVAYSLVASATIKNLKITDNTVKSDNNLCSNGVHLVSGNATFTDVEVAHNNLKNIVTTSVKTTGTSFTNLLVKDNLEKVPFRTFANGDTTPSVLGGELFKTANTGATAISSFANGYAGQQIIIIFGDINSTINETGNIKVIGGTSITPGLNDAIRFIYDGTNWYEVK